MNGAQASVVPWPLRVPTCADDVWAASYPEFVAMVNQTNVMPGAYVTLSAWALHSRMDASSSVLDVACSTGFASRELARLTGCRAAGFDLSAGAVALAKLNHQAEGADLRLRYTQADGYAYRPDEHFTHVVVGAALGFFPDPAAMAGRLVELLDDGGYVLASPFYVEAPLPDEMAEIRRTVFGITAPMESYKEAVGLFRGFQVVHETRNVLVPETDEEIEQYCQSTIARACRQSGVADAATRATMLERLRLVKRATNRLREHQRYAVLVLRYRAPEYPNRYVELF